MPPAMHSTITVSALAGIAGAATRLAAPPVKAASRAAKVARMKSRRPNPRKISCSTFMRCIETPLTLVWPTKIFKTIHSILQEVPGDLPFSIARIPAERVPVNAGDECISAGEVWRHAVRPSPPTRTSCRIFGA